MYLFFKVRTMTECNEAVVLALLRAQAAIRSQAIVACLIGLQSSYQ